MPADQLQRDKAVTGPSKALTPAGQTWLRTRMSAETMTGVVIASRLGVTTKHMSQLLNGRVPMSDALADQIANILGVSATPLKAMRFDGHPARIEFPAKPTGDVTFGSGYEPDEPMEGWWAGHG